jgi:hypothetical protein
MAEDEARKPLPSYLHRLLTAAAELATMPGVSHCMAQHDDGCAIFQRQGCTCVPDISIVPVNGGSVTVTDAQGEAHKSSRQ